MANMNAWILDFGAGYKAAVGARELIHLIDVHATFQVPCAPAYCNKLVTWQERLLPVMDVVCRLGDTTLGSHFIAVVGYQPRQGGQPQFGALLLATPPKNVVVSDEQACELPEHTPGWAELAISCFDLQGESVPILNLNSLFNRLPVPRLQQERG
jgi:hypothetical protein